MDPLLTAIVDDDPPVVKKLLKSDRSLAIRPLSRPHLFRAGIFHWMYVGDTPLHLAAAGHRVEIARLLLAAGADPNAIQNHRRSGPLHYAADGRPGGPCWDSNRQVETLRCLLDAGARINAPDKNGATPLHRAVRTRSAAAVRFLLQAGADPTLKNKPGSTPFHLAVQNTGRGGSGTQSAKTAQRQIIETFLSVGISPTLRDAGGKSVRDWARSDWIGELLAGKQ